MSNKLMQVTKSVGISIKKHSPEILTGVGIVGMVGTTVLAVKATPKALMLIEEEKRRINNDILEAAKADGLEEVERVEKLTPVDTVKTVWKCYIPAIATGTLSVLCLVGASSINARRNAALLMACALSDSTLKEYRDKVVETVGEKKEKEVRDNIAKERLEKDPISNKEVVMTDKGDTLCYDVLSGRYFKSSVDIINKAVNEVNRRMINYTYISLNEFYSEIGLSGTKLGNDLGWCIDQGTIEIDFSAQLADDGTPCLVVDYMQTPQYNFDRLL